MPARSLLTASQPIENLTHSPKQETAEISMHKRRLESGRKLSHLVSKFEILDSLSRQSKPLATKKANLPGANDSTLQLNRAPSSHSSVSARSLYHHAVIDKPEDLLPGQGEAHKDDEPATAEAHVSLVAERRRLFEVKLGDASLSRFQDCVSSDAVDI
ncbi:hypothetical protein E4U42_002884 [Claviceps africana]|uniref:Uncharacterized protein n=1 Tax=Claviceps africana TaxID=83212 RepID=A0A8K0JCJ3_9HYPO|nr:hypothetical protein E4U42_002884 [Claviceps africana]